MSRTCFADGGPGALVPLVAAVDSTGPAWTAQILPEAYAPDERNQTLTAAPINLAAWTGTARQRSLLQG